MTYAIPLQAGVDLKLYNSAVTFSKPEISTDELNTVVVRIATTAKSVHHEVVLGELIHPGVVKRGAYVEFFHRDSRGRRQWQTPTMIGVEGEAWTVAVNELTEGVYEVSFGRS